LCFVKENYVQKKNRENAGECVRASGRDGCGGGGGGGGRGGNGALRQSRGDTSGFSENAIKLAAVLASYSSRFILQNPWNVLRDTFLPLIIFSFSA
jgi:hypothetical protein